MDIEYLPGNTDITRKDQQARVQTGCRLPRGVVYRRNTSKPTLSSGLRTLIAIP
jgi:hypothetical protein